MVRGEEERRKSGEKGRGARWRRKEGGKRD